MADRISSLPDAVLCYILSFLPTKVAVATSVLSKRWKPLWRSVPSLNFNDDDHYYDQNKSHETYSHFVQSVYTFIITRDLDQPLQRFHLRCRSSFCKNANVRSWLIAAAQRRVEHLDLYVHEPIELPSLVLRCKTLVVLKLTRLRVKALPSVDLPLLKILHFKRVEFLEQRYLVEFLVGSPNLEDLEAKEVYVPNYKTETRFKRLPKLLRAVVVKNGIPLDFVYNVQFLRIDNMVHCEDPIPEFHNLTHIEFGSLYYKYCPDVLEVLNHCPKLQNISIEKKQLYSVYELDEGDNWPCPQCVPKCISLHLKTCCLMRYTGTTGEFEFAKYIMQNARVLQDMTICTYTIAHHEGKLEMIRELSLCTRLSSVCKLSFNCNC